MSQTPQEQADLMAAGWRETSPHNWESPEGRLVRGMYRAWKVMDRTAKIRANNGFKLPKMPVTLYKITCETPNCFYIGVTHDVQHRFVKHQKGTGAQFTRKHGAKTVESIAVFHDAEAALAAEKAYTLQVRAETGGIVAGANQCWSKWG